MQKINLKFLLLMPINKITITDYLMNNFFFLFLLMLMVIFTFLIIKFIIYNNIKTIH